MCTCVKILLSESISTVFFRRNSIARHTMTRELLNKKLGNNIRKFRLSADISQEALAKKAGLYPAYLGRLERGEKCPTIDTLYKICKALGISMSDVLTFDKSMYDLNTEALSRIEHVLDRLEEPQQIKVAEIVEHIAEI